MEEWGVKIDSVRTLDRKIFFDKKGKMQTKKEWLWLEMSDILSWNCINIFIGIIYLCIKKWCTDSGI